MRVRDVMTTPVLTTHPATPLREAALVLAREGVSGLPVVDAAGSVVGVLSEADIVAKEGRPHHKDGLLGWLLEPADPWLDERLRATTVGDAMTAPALTIEPDRPITEAATVMTEEGVNRLPVVADGQLVGLVTRADLVRAFVRTDDEIRDEIRDEVIRQTLWIDPSTLEITVTDGHVRIVGTVSNQSELELLERFVRRVPGVVDVAASIAVGA
jgi:CBS domain-containing protein